MKRNLICVVGTGRNGSSLLCSALHGAGLDFGAEFSTDWEKSSGNFEHSGLHRAFSYLFRSNKLKSLPFCNRLSQHYYKKCAKIMVDFSLGFDCLKSSKLLYLVPFLRNSDVNVKLIILIREFNGYCISRHKRFNGSFDEIENSYIRDMKQLLMLSALFDHIVVDFDELVRGPSVDMSAIICNFVECDVDLFRGALQSKSSYGTLKNQGSRSFRFSESADDIFALLKRKALT